MSKRNNDYWRKPEIHTEIKHKILKSYLGGWTSILGRKAKALYYVDTHAGRGKHDDNYLGSPILAMQVAQEVLTKNPDIEIEYYFHNVEESAENFASLTNEINFHSSSYPDFHVTNYLGNFQIHTDTILSKIPSDRASFVFIDPFGYKDAYIPDMIKFIKNRRYSELFITFMSQWISQFLSDPTKADNFDRILNSTEWRDFIGKPDAERKVVELYSRQIRDAAIQQEKRNFWVYPISIKRASQLATYYLIHLTQDPKGRIVMEKAERAAFRNDYKAEALFIPPTIEQALFEAVKKRRNAKVLDIAGEVWKSLPTASFVEQITKGLKDLHSVGIVKIYKPNNALLNKTVKPDENDIVQWTGEELESTQSGLF
jgi:three-Cys-motif partner protein